MLVLLLAETTGPSPIAYMYVFAIQRERVLCIARRQGARARLEIWMLQRRDEACNCKRSERNNIILLQLALHCMWMWMWAQAEQISRGSSNRREGGPSQNSLAEQWSPPACPKQRSVALIRFRWRDHKLHEHEQAAKPQRDCSKPHPKQNLKSTSWVHIRA